MGVKVNFEALYEKNEDLVIALALLYRLYKLGDMSAKEIFLDIISEPTYLQRAIDVANENKGNIFFLACDMIGDDELKEIFGSLDYAGDPEILRDLYDLCPMQFAKDNISFFDQYYSIRKIHDSFKKTVDLKVDSDEVFLITASDKPQDDMIFLSIKRAAEPSFSEKLLYSDNQPADIAMLARYLDAKCGRKSAYRAFVKSITQPSYIALLCSYDVMFDLMLNIVKPRELIGVLRYWKKDEKKDEDDINEDSDTMEVVNVVTSGFGRKLYDNFLEQPAGRRFYSDFRRSFRKAGL